MSECNVSRRTSFTLPPRRIFESPSRFPTANFHEVNLQRNTNRRVGSCAGDHAEFSAVRVGDGCYRHVSGTPCFRTAPPARRRRADVYFTSYFFCVSGCRAFFPLAQRPPEPRFRFPQSLSAWVSVFDSASLLSSASAVKISTSDQSQSRSSRLRVTRPRSPSKQSLVRS